jgi:D-lactate dehydrogenase
MSATLETPPAGFKSPVARRRPSPDLTNEQIAASLAGLIGPEQVLSKLIERTMKAGDASIYRLVPRVVVLPRDTSDVKAILSYCRENNLYLTFRAAGTSLSGQAVTDGILVDISRGWKGLRIEEGAGRVAVEPGVIAAHVNAFLAPHKAKIGPDPASIGACMMGGVAANNASGMCCGVQFNSYHTMHSMKLVLTDGLELDTAMPDADERLRNERPEIYDGLIRIRDRMRSDSELADRVRRKFSVKNTCGYSMNAFVDFERPVDILAHLLIGSEGTLGYIAEITLNTLPDLPVKATSLVYFADLVDAGRAIKPLADAGAAVLEIMDRASMASVEDEMDYPFTLAAKAVSEVSSPAEFAEAKADARLRGEARDTAAAADAVPPEQVKPVVAGNCAALLIEFQEDSEDAVQKRLADAARILEQFKLLAPVSFTRDPAKQADFWHMRKGLFPSVGAMREIGTAVIIEDVCVQPKFLADAIQDIQTLFVKYEFPDAIIFGHAKDGNIHFVICTDFADPAQVTRYAGLMDELTAVIVKRYDGSLKAEHGTGRNIAPFVEREWGKHIYDLMWEVKRLLDPDMVLSPGVVLDRDPQAHLKHLKVMPAVSPIVDKCIECGFCEPRCPSRNLTTTPRQRISVLREIERLLRSKDPANTAIADELLREYEYYGNETCATDGMCATACPVKINTGEMIKDLRHDIHSPGAKRIAAVMASNFGLLSKGAWAGLTAIRLGGPVSLGIARAGANLGFKLSGGKIPRLPKAIPVPRPAPKLPARSIRRAGSSAEKAIVYFPTCLTRSLGSIPGERVRIGVAEALIAVLEKCGWAVTIPPHINSVCCGQPFFSKGFYEAGAIAAERTINMLWEETHEGRLPIVCDTSPCSGQFGQCDKYLQGEALARWKKLRILDMPTFLAREVIPTRTDWPRLNRRAVLHPTCTLIKLGGLPDLKKVANTFASDIEVPVLAECCGFAGDRGFLYPELTLSATAPESAEVRHNVNTRPPHTVVDPTTPEPRPLNPEARFYSSCRTCELGMTAGTQEVYSSIIHLVYDALFPEQGT